MAFEIKYRRGTTAEHSSFLGRVGEITIDTTDNRLVVHDGSTVGGIELATENDPSAGGDIVDDTTPQLGGNLDVNGNSIVSVSGGNVTIEPNGTGDIILNSNTVVVEQEIGLLGDPGNDIVFGTDTQNHRISNSSKFDISDSGLRLGGANSRVTTISDSDTLATNSDTALVTQQALKAYIDTQAASSGTSSLEHISTTTVSSATSNVDFTLSGTYDHFMILYSDVIMSAATGTPTTIRVSNNGGTSFITTSTYRFLLEEALFASSTGSLRTGTSETYITISWHQENNAGLPGSGRVMIYDALNSSYRTRVDGHTVRFDGGGNGRTHLFMGLNTTQEAHNAIQLYWPTTTIASGNFYLYGIKDS